MCVPRSEQEDEELQVLEQRLPSSLWGDHGGAGAYSQYCDLRRGACAGAGSADGNCSPWRGSILQQAKSVRRDQQRELFQAEDSPHSPSTCMALGEGEGLRNAGVKMREGVVLIYLFFSVYKLF